MTKNSSSRSSYLAMLLTAYVPIMVYGLVSPFSGSFLIILFVIHVSLSGYGLFLALRQNKIFILLHIAIFVLMALLVFFSSVPYWSIAIMFLAVGFAECVAFLAQPDFTEFRGVLISRQAMFFILATLSVLNIRNIIMIKRTSLPVGNPFSFVHAGVVALLSGYAFLNVKQMGYSEAGKLSVFSFIGGIVLLLIGVFDILTTT